jgi:hypothetical protein
VACSRFTEAERVYHATAREDPTLLGGRDDVREILR